MSTNALVRTAWQENVFANIDQGLTSYSRKIELTSQEEIELVYTDDTKKILYWTYVVNSTWKYYYMGTGNNNAREVGFKVEIEHIREKEEGGDDTAFNAVLDAFETLGGLVRTNLSATWDGTVDLWNEPSEVEIDSITIEGRHCWRGKQIYKATKRVAS